MGYLSLALGPTGSPVVSYFLTSGDSTLLKYATCSKGSWQSEQVAVLGSSSNDYYCSTCVTPGGGIPLIVYLDPINGFSDAWKSGGCVGERR